MGKKQNQLYQQLMSLISRMERPENNPAQNYLTQEALAGAEFFKKGEYGAGALPKGMFFDFQAPAEQVEKYKKYANVNQGGTFALGDDGAMGKAGNLQKQFLADRFARDASQNYQDNIRNAAVNIRGALGQAAGAKNQTDASVMNALQGMYTKLASQPSGWGAILGPAAQIGAAAITKF